MEVIGYKVQAIGKAKNLFPQIWSHICSNSWLLLVIKLRFLPKWSMCMKKFTLYALIKKSYEVSVYLFTNPVIYWFDYHLSEMACLTCRALSSTRSWEQGGSPLVFSNFGKLYFWAQWSIFFFIVKHQGTRFISVKIQLDILKHSRDMAILLFNT